MDLKRLCFFSLAIVVFINTYIISVFADNSTSSNSIPKKVLLYLKPDITVELNGEKKIFKDVNGITVYPIIYNGSTYLPVRAVSSLMQEPIEWDSGSKTVFIGKTISYPNKKGAPITTAAAVTVDSEYVDPYQPPQCLVTGYLKPDVLVMYDFTIQSLQDANGDTVYPIIYNGSVYLPIRAISTLIKEPIVWDGLAKKITIGNEEAEEEHVADPEEETSEASLLLKDLFEREEVLYYESTAIVTSIKNAASTEEKQILAASASENYLRAQALTLEAKTIDQTNFTDEERNACEKQIAFAESNEYYILVLENIAYLAASESDYSMLADTFLYFALDAKTKMEEAERVLIEQLLN